MDMEDIIITMAIATLLATIKRPEKREHLKKAMLKVRNAINAAYADDEDFA